MSRPTARLLVTIEEALSQAISLAEGASGGARGDLEAAVSSLETAVRKVIQTLDRESRRQESERRKRTIAQVLRRRADKEREGEENEGGGR